MISHPIDIDNIQTTDLNMSVAPQVLPKLQIMVSDCNTNPDDIRDMIRLDPALSGMILKTANSAFYNPGYHIDSIDDAIMHLGFADVYQIVTMLAFTDMLSGPLPTYDLTAGQFWKRSAAAAFAMERLARKYGEDPGVAYTIGLLHSLGMVFIEREIRNSATVKFRSSLPEDVALANEELEIFGVNHAKVGSAVMRSWGFSDEVVVPVFCQFEPSEAGRHERMACLVSFAKRMIGTIINDPDSSAKPGPDPLLIALLHLSKDEYGRVVEGLRRGFDKAKGLVSEKIDTDYCAKAKAETRDETKASAAMANTLGYGQRAIRP